MSALRTIANGITAGAAGTTALNAVTYLDMATRARPASESPQKAVEELAAHAAIRFPDKAKTAKTGCRVSAPWWASSPVSGLGPWPVRCARRCGSFRFRPPRP